VLTLGAVGTFVTGWLLPRLPEFYSAHPFVDQETPAMNSFSRWLLARREVTSDAA